MKIHALKLYKGEDLLKSIEKFARNNHIFGSVILSSVGTMSIIQMLRPVEDESEKDDAPKEEKSIAAELLGIRKAQERKLVKRIFLGPYELIAISGTAAEARTNLTVTFADEDGKLFAGKLVTGCIVGETAEIIFGAFSSDEIVFPETSEGTRDTDAANSKIALVPEYDSLVTQLFMNSGKSEDEESEAETSDQ